MRVFLIHGMARTPLSMLRFARELRRAGYRPELMGYAAAFESYAGIVARLRKRLVKAALGGEPYAIVAHSLGGILARSALDQWPAECPLPRHLILLGTPNRPSRMACRFHRWWPYRLVNGECGQLLTEPKFFAALPRPAIPITVIAGTKSWPGPFNLFGAAPNDGMVAVDEARLAGNDAALVELPVSHTFMMNSGQVRRVVQEILDQEC
ncbi:MAG TPA: alpha/beta fold hydrolase [Gemmatimonadales bacterium]|nr:alpha/beta fold hydrolase [Gemmatimonadales bacterium]